MAMNPTSIKIAIYINLNVIPPSMALKHPERLVNLRHTLS